MILHSMYAATSGGELVGFTPSARASIYLLRLNHPHRVQERLLRFGWLWTREEGPPKA